MRVHRFLVAVILFALSIPADAQQVKKVPRIGFLAATSAIPGRTDAFRKGLRELGYVEGKTIIYEYQYAEGKVNRLRELAAELVRLNVDVIVTAGTAATRSAKEATSTIPIVMTNDNDPVGDGFVASLARPGKNITGLTNLLPDLSGKRLELLKEVFPKFSRIAVLWNPTNSGSPVALRETEVAARALRVELQPLEVRKAEDFDGAFQAITKGHVDAIMVLGDPLSTQYRMRIVEFAAKSRLPAIYNRQEFVEDGGLMSYATDLSDLFRRAAMYVDKILKGAKPADLPVEQPTKFEFIINLKAAKQIGLTIPANVLLRADKVIK
jgi:ABC-type uncharacterized transport system substrate-binding protein